MDEQELKAKIQEIAAKHGISEGMATYYLAQRHYEKTGTGPRHTCIDETGIFRGLSALRDRLSQPKNLRTGKECPSP